MDVRLLHASDDVATAVVALVNPVYAVAEAGLWRPGMRRTTVTEAVQDISDGLLHGAFADGVLVGVVRVHEARPGVGCFGMLAAAPEHRGRGIGNALLDQAEAVTRERRRTTMELELLVPRVGTHPSKELLRGWYRRRGYALARVGRLEDDHPHLEPLLAVECDLEIHARAL